MQQQQRASANRNNTAELEELSFRLVGDLQSAGINVRCYLSLPEILASYIVLIGQ